MARIEVVMPQMGESIVEGTVIRWLKKVGESVRKDETLLEISTDKVDSEIPSPASGVLAEIVAAENTTVPVRSVIAYLETDGAGSTEAGTAPASASPRAAPPVEAVALPAPSAKGEASVPLSAGRFYSPLVLSVARTEGIAMDELEQIRGTGEGNRVTKKDLLAYVAAKKSIPAPPPAAPRATAGGAALQPADAPDLRAKYPSPAHEILQMSAAMQKMAHHMVQSVQTSPHVAAVHEVDMTRVVRHRDANAGEFERKEGFKLTYTPYIVEAVVRAMKKYPLVNSSVEGDKIIRKTFIHCGLAVASENGLIVPVIRHAEEKNFVGLARAVHDVAGRARAKKLTPDDVQGGTFTITNYGVFGTLIGTPIIHQPQVAILGTGAVTKRAVVIDDAIAIRPMSFFTLSFDHRIVDGAMGGMFLEEIARNLEQCDTDMKF